MDLGQLFHPSSRPAGQGITIGTPQLYDLFARVVFGGARPASYRRLIQAAGVQRGDRALDVGCGPGRLARMLAETVGPTGWAVGIDAAPEMIEYATRKARHLSNCRFEAGTGESLAFADASFDVVVSSLMIHHLPEEIRGKAVGEMKRVLRPGGSLLIADFSVSGHGGWHILAALTGHGRNGFGPAAQMARRVSPLEPLVEQGGFGSISAGDAPPWLHYVAARKP